MIIINSNSILHFFRSKSYNTIYNSSKISKFWKLCARIPQNHATPTCSIPQTCMCRLLQIWARLCKSGREENRRCSARLGYANLGCARLGALQIWGTSGCVAGGGTGEGGGILGECAVSALQIWQLQGGCFWANRSVGFANLGPICAGEEIWVNAHLGQVSRREGVPNVDTCWSRVFQIPISNLHMNWPSGGCQDAINHDWRGL